MSSKYPGGIISKTAPTPSGPYADSTAPGVWTLEQQAYWQKLGQWPTAGNVNPSAFIENLFSTYLYQADGSSTQTITNGIDLSGQGGLVWIKSRSNATGNVLVDTVRGSPNVIQSNNANAQASWTNEFGSFSSTGFTVPYNTIYGETNFQTRTYASWTFREQAKFFDVVTWTGDGTGNRAIPHSLGSTPNFITTKQTNGSESWWSYHKSVTSPNSNWWRNWGVLNGTNAFTDWGDDSGLYQSPDANNLYIGSWYNGSGKTYVAYLFASNAGGFGLTGTDNVISCGSYTGNGSANGPVVNLGYEPQWVLTKGASTNANYAWQIVDNMRGIPMSGNTQALFPNDSGAESAWQLNGMQLSATGFQITAPYAGVNASGETYIYIAIRRGPMKTPTVGTSVFDIQQYTGTQSSNPGVARNITTTIRTDVNITSAKNAGFDIGVFFDRLRGPAQYIGSNSTNSEGTMPGSAAYQFWNDKYILGGYYLDYTGYQYVNYSLQRAPGFFDEVCYTGTGTDDRQVAHNLGVAPELIICKSRSAAWPWWVGGSVLGSTRNGIYLNDTGARQVNADAFSTNGASFTSSYFLVSSVSAYPPNANTYTQVAYLFATCAGVSKVGSYTGNATLTTINCGFTGGARFVMIKRTDTTGNWFFWDTSRGMVSGTDPSLAFNTSAAESNANSVYTITTGFQLLASPSADVNTNGGTYIYLAIA